MLAPEHRRRRPDKEAQSTLRKEEMLLSDGLVLSLCTLLISCVLTQCKVFLDQSSAGQLLLSSRRRRANSNFLEEIMPGNLERECYEEICSQEEVAEIFGMRERTLEFWFRYTNLNPCRTNPCLNGGFCTLDRGNFVCLCPPQFHGKTCDSAVLECSHRNGGCKQYCADLPGDAGVQCGCAEGFKLDSDGLGCSKTVEFPCGRQQNEAFYSVRSLLTDSPPDNSSDTASNATSWARNITDGGTNTTEKEERLALNVTDVEAGGNQTQLWEEDMDGDDTRIVGGLLQKRGGSPWQVLVRRSDGYGFCGGTLVSERWVISAAHCFQDTAPHHVSIGDYDKQRPDPGEQIRKVQKVVFHPHFHAFTFDSDIALLYLAKPVAWSPTVIAACLPDAHLAKYLLKEDNRGMVTGWGAMQYLGHSSRFLRKVVLPVVKQRDCMSSTDQVITDNMFCAGYLEASIDACSGDSGGPFVVNYRGTWFLTGVVSWGERCAAKGKYGVYTRLGNYLGWIRDTMDKQTKES
ncbi:coagulation factor VII [Genypterus blacodes]|uniref:coagulation factor VII n=1 Tax=Genypterus blacodes TaxID=154954 RepID=UPI003F770938